MHEHDIDMSGIGSPDDAGSIKAKSEVTPTKERDMDQRSYQELLFTEAPRLAEKNAEYFSLLAKSWSERLNNPKTELWLKWAQETNAWKLLSRDRRARDLAKTNEEGAGLLDLAREKARRVMGENIHHYICTCIDGRCIPAIMLSHLPHFGSVIRTQAGEQLGVQESVTGRPALLKRDSFEAHALKRLLENKPGGTIYYSFDSHIGCAARKLKHERGVRSEGDNGLLMDVERKIEIANSFVDFANELGGKNKNLATIVPQLFSYDPHDGTLVMGLEMHVDAVKGVGFTDEIQSQLSAEGKIVKTWDFLKNAEIAKELEAAVLPADFRGQFSESALNNWTAIEKLWDNGNGLVYQTILNSLSQAYQNGGFEIGEEDSLSGRKISIQTLEHKAKVMLKNLVTRWSLAKNEHDWPFAQHLEQGIVITDGGYGPFQPEGNNIPPDVFAVFSGEDHQFQLQHIKLGVGLIRSFREKGSIEDPTGMLVGKDFAEAPVMLFNHAVLRNISEETWQQLRKIDFMEVLKTINWDDPKTSEWGMSEIKNLLREKLKGVNITYTEGETLDKGFLELFERVRDFMDDPEFRSWIANGNILLINKLVNNDRQPQVFAPMVF